MEIKLYNGQDLTQDTSVKNYMDTFFFCYENINNMNKGTHFIGQPMYGQLISLLDRSKIIKFSRENGGERYVKHFDA